MIDWDKLRIFLQVSSSLSISQAGDKLNLHSSTVGRHIQSLERSLGFPLFYRQQTGLRLTKQGRILRDTTERMNRKLERGLGEIADIHESVAGTLKLHSTITVGMVVTSSVVAHLTAKYPQLKIKLILDDKDVDLMKNEADVSLRLHRSEEADVIERKLFTFNLKLFASPEYLKKNGEPKSLEELANHRLIAFGEDGAKPFRNVNWFLRLGSSESSSLEAVLTVNNFTAVYRAIRSHIGIGSIPEFVIAEDVRLQRVLPQLQGPKISLFFVYPTYLRGSRRVAALWDALQSRTKQFTAHN